MTEQEHMQLHADHRARIQRLEQQIQLLAQNTEKITDAHEKALKVHGTVINQVVGAVKQNAQQVQGLAGYAETFTARGNTQPGGTRSVLTTFQPGTNRSLRVVQPEDAEVADDND